MSTGYVLHHRHLRQHDHAAIATAAQNHDRVVPIFVFDEQFYTSGMACDARLQFLHESLQDIDVSLFHGDPVSVVNDLDGPVYMLQTATGRYGNNRNARLREAGVQFVQGDLLRRCDNPRDGWSETIESRLKNDCYERPDNIETITTDVTISGIEAKYDVSPTKDKLFTGGRVAALTRLSTFIDDTEYWGHISEPTKARGASMISPYLRFGCVSVREVYQLAQEELSGRNKSAFISRLFWNLHYKQKLADWSGWMDTAINPVCRSLGEDNDEYWEQFTAGETGYPMVDAAVRQLKATGWLTFRNRAMLASFVGHLLQLPWKRGADWMYYHLIDADPAINYTQWQYQTSRVGTDLYRIYNPRKQVRDSDEAADWITKWVPELASLPKQFLDRPERTPLHVQQDTVRIGDDYPYPIVEYEQAREKITQELQQREQEIYQAMDDDTFQQRASFSARGGSEQGNIRPNTRNTNSNDKSHNQSSLTDNFT